MLSLTDQITDLTCAGYWMWTSRWGLLASPEVHAGVERVLGGNTPVPVVDSMVHPSDRVAVRQSVHEGLRTPEGFDLVHRCLDTDGTVRTLRSRGRGTLDADGVLIAACGSLQDVTHLTAMAAEVTRARDLFGMELDIGADRSIIGLDLQGGVTLFDSGAQRMLGYRPEEILGAPVPPEIHDAAEVQARADDLGIEYGFEVVVGAATSGGTETRQWTYITRSGRRLQVRVTVSALLDAGGRIIGYIKSGVDITERVARHRARAAGEALFEEMFDHAANGMMLADVSVNGQARIVRANPALCRITGYTQQQLLTMSVADLVHPDQHGHTRQVLQRLTEGESVLEETERHWVHATGRDVWVQLSVTVIRNADTLLTLGTVVDITARRDNDHELQHLATHDQLTGLPNRYLLADRLNQALLARDRREVALLFIDLDGFKAVNDTFGHAVGDQVLRAAAGRLEQQVRGSDTVSRIGGDEFVVVCPNLITSAAATHLAHRLAATWPAPTGRAPAT